MLRCPASPVEYSGQTMRVMPQLQQRIDQSIISRSYVEVWEVI